MGELLFFRRRQVDPSPVSTQTDGEFMRLVRSGSPRELRELLRQGANPNVVGQNGEQTSAMIVAACRGSRTLKLMAEYGANMNIRDDSGRTALHVVATQGWERSVAISRVLLAYGAAVNVVDNQGWTPVMKAVLRLNVDLVGLFLDRGADPTLRNSDGQTALDLLGDSGSEDANKIRRLLQMAGSRS